MREDEFVSCSVRELPPDLHEEAARTAIALNPANAPVAASLPVLATALSAFGVVEGTPVEPPPTWRLAVLTSKYWGAGGVKLTVGFMDSPPADLRARILNHMNAWSKSANVQFVESSVSPQVRIDRGGGGYWSYLGTDILHIPTNRPTMNLQGFTMNTPEREFVRVVRHETGHTLGFPHEHMRREIIARLDINRTIDYFRRTQGWSAEDVRQQVLVPLEERSILATAGADQTSIMCYQLPGSITVDGQPVPGGLDINESDYSFAARLYPKAVAPPPPEDGPTLVLSGLLQPGKYKLTPLT